MALSANTKYTQLGAGGGEIEIANSAVVYQNALVAINHRRFTTTGARGRLNRFTASNGRIPLGIAIPVSNGLPATGNSSSTPPPRAGVALNSRIALLTITGLAGTAADVGREVWASDDGTFVLLRAAKYAWAGVVIKENNSTTAYVLMPSASESLVFQRAVTRYAWNLGTFSGILASGASYTFSGLHAPHHFSLVRLIGRVVSAVGRNTPNIDIWMKIGGTVVSASTISWIGSNAIGKKISGAALASNLTTKYAHENDIVSIVLKNSTGSAAAAGMVNVYALCETELGN